ncbi:MAG: winged helix-turn-helix transcriptional regulator [Chloroflexota bacterium]|nr:MAG: hypothetical protein DLM70_10305 [Chloroflexota bacterium]
MQAVTEAQPGPATEGPQEVVMVDAVPRRLQPLAEELETFGLQTSTCAPEEMIPAITTRECAAVILGAHLTPLQTWDLSREVRRRIDVPIVALVGTQGADYLSMALDAGADAAFPGTETISARLIVSAMQAIQRRERLGTRVMSSIVEAGPLRIDLYRKTVEVDGSCVPLTATEFGILAVLAQQPGRVVSATEIVKQVHGYDASEGEAQDIVKVHISRLRQKLEVGARPAGGIANVRGQGYMYLFERRSESPAFDNLSHQVSGSSGPIETKTTVPV